MAEFTAALVPKVSGMNTTKIQSVTLVKASASAAVEHPQPRRAVAKQMWKEPGVQPVLNPMDKNLGSP